MAPEIELSNGKSLSINGNVDLVDWDPLNKIQIYIDKRQPQDILKELRELNGTRGQIIAIQENNRHGHVYFDPSVHLTRDLYGLTIEQWQTQYLKIQAREYPERVLLDQTLETELVIGRTPFKKKAKRYWRFKKFTNPPDERKYVIRPWMFPNILLEKPIPFKRGDDK